MQRVETAAPADTGKTMKFFVGFITVTVALGALLAAFTGRWDIALFLIVARLSIIIEEALKKWGQ